MNPVAELQMRRMVKQRTRLMLQSPFFSSLVLRLVLVAHEPIGTAATDGRYLWFNPLFISSLTDDEVMFVIAHELAHCFLLHPMRCGSRDPYKANIAMDHVVNLMLEDCVNPSFSLIKHDVPPHFMGGVVMDTKYKGMYFEQVYALLPDPPPQQGGKGGKDGDGPQAPQTNGGLGQVIKPQAAPEDGGAPGSQGPMSKEKAKALEEDWKIAATQAATMAKAAGRLPGDLERYVNEALRSKVDWKEVLNRFTANSMEAKDYQWTPPNRRFISEDIYLPSIHKEGIGPIAVWADASGSVTQQLFDQWSAETNDIVHSAQPEYVLVGYFDTCVQGEPQRFGPDENIRLQVRAGGGTDFRPAFQWMKDHAVIPVACVVLTDLYCDDYPEEPSFPVLWATTTRDRVAPWGETVLIEES